MLDPLARMRHRRPGGCPAALDRPEAVMWYFSWVLGLGLACAFAILNAMWFELREDDDRSPRG
jgi:cyd operon protein YbgT